MAAIIKNRKLKVEGMTCDRCESNIEKNLSQLDGVLNVKADKSGSIEVDYNLMKVGINGLEKAIRESGFNMPNGFFVKFFRGWAAFTEQNEVDNMSHTPHSCCSIPAKK